MKVLMFGWEFPPFNKGGLGTACYGLTRGLRNNNVDVTFVVPKAPRNVKGDYVNLLVADNFYTDSGDDFKIVSINSLLSAYMDDEKYSSTLTKVKTARKKEDVDDWSDDIYGGDLYSEVFRYAGKSRLVSAMEDHDIIHAHDWMAYPAGIEAHRVSGKPLVVHIHATEFDRTGGNCNPKVYDIERAGLHAADKVIAVSNLTKRRVVESYGVDPDKVFVVHNAVDFDTKKFNKSELKASDEDKVILFLGRITMQKGPEYFLQAAKKVIDYSPDSNVKFVFAGTGDMEGKMIELAAELGISDKVHFEGWVTGPDIDRLYSLADLYVMPSVSEPFGITPLEAMRNNTPVLISKQSGVSEVVNHAMKIDFWDVDEMAEKMLAVLHYTPLQSTLAENGSKEVKKFNWDEPAAKCIDVYEYVLGSENQEMDSGHVTAPLWD